MRVKREHFRSPKELPQVEYITPGSPLCAGCGGLTTLRLMHKVLGENVVVVNAAGCMTLMAVYPFTPLRSSWLYTTMASAAAGAQGIRDAIDVLMERGRLRSDEDLHVLVLAGDGSTYDMGLSATSGAIHRHLNFWYLCYDNEAYGNTGFQMSASSPLGSRTATSTARTVQHKKDIFELWRAQQPPYVATVCAHDAVDLAEKVERAREYTGPKLFLSLAVCPTGWGFDPELSDEIAKLAIETGVWPLKEAVNGKVRHTYIPNRFRPVEEYLQPQRRFAHLFAPSRNDEVLTEIQRNVDEYWQPVREVPVAAAN
ncbi:MAG: thiamine pyrophosphate-dependent enzyme [Planctomycetota bacterium]|jgi:pyruvate ferredoxin oxidoreductase beta subunit